ncbi:transmembrane protein 119b [Gouania willdenowi]|uniref:Transmembrane protein 119-like n=1 Tax=Gouania willdenowi TaxID=441366 RepID=A0A8C5HIZ5_GOUWI|nr:transmembrane protein 119-like [Gouania willdenowi]
MLRQRGLLLLFGICSGMASPLVFYSPLEGSADGEELISFSLPLPTTSLSSENKTTPVGPTQEETNSLKDFENFLNKNMLLILIAAVILLLLFITVCAAVFVSRRCKVNAYYPSAFPPKMYVDQHDKTGGANLFHEVQENKAAPKQVKEHMDSHKQLQADIMKAAKSLRTPTKSEKSDPDQKGPKAADPDPEHSLILDCSTEAQQLQSLPEEKEPRGHCDSEAAADMEQSHRAEEEGSQQPVGGRSLRPSSLHIHNDSATLQLIAGEKTAF